MADYHEPVAERWLGAEVVRKLPRAERRRQLRGWIAEAKVDAAAMARAGLLGLGCQAALIWLAGAMEAEADALCGGPKGRHNVARTGWRHGYECGSVVLGGCKVAVARPRVRSRDGRRELELESYQAAQDERFLDAAALSQTLVGVAQRSYGPALGGIVQAPDAVAVAVSKSAVGRRVVSESAALLKAMLTRSLAGKRYLALVLDGLEMGGQHVIVALGISPCGEKEILGLWQGPSESGDVCRGLLADLVRRGLAVDQDILVIIDGGKGLFSAVTALFGRRAYIQRCQCHKKRNVLDKLSRGRRAGTARAMRQAWAESDPDLAQRHLQELADRLQQQGESAAANSLREGLEQTLTCARLGIAPQLRRSLCNTNLIESAFSQHERIAHRVKRWRNGRQALRWAAATLAVAEKAFAILPGAEHLGQLAEVLGHAIPAGERAIA